jgi:hypothetical protein
MYPFLFNLLQMSPIRNSPNSGIIDAPRFPRGERSIIQLNCEIAKMSESSSAEAGHSQGQGQGQGHGHAQGQGQGQSQAQAQAQARDQSQVPSASSGPSAMALGPETFPEMERILLSILSRPESDAFKEPVDHKALGLFDYLNIVKHPMDLGTVKRKFDSGEYESVESMANDIRLIWTNCMLYNRDGSEV